MPVAHIVKNEDARTGQWLRHLDPVTNPVQRMDMGWTMGDWNQLDVTIETVALRELILITLLMWRLVENGQLGRGATQSAVTDMG
jgi:hypothetical protein